LIHFYKSSRLTMLPLPLLLVLLVPMMAEEEIPMEGGVMVLGQDNFQAAIDANAMVLVEFYAPWCGHCKKLAPEYEAAAAKLTEAGSNVKLAKVDATEHKELGQKFEVKGFPTLKFFKNGEPQEYTGGRTADTILAWIKKKAEGIPELKTEEAAKDLVADNKVVAIGFFKDPASPQAEAFKAAADTIEDTPCAITSSPEVFKLHEVATDAAVVILKKFDEGRNQLDGEITKESVTSFISSNSLPLVVDFHADTAKQIFQGSIKNHLILFLSAKDDKFEYVIHDARKVAGEYKGDVMFVSVTTDEEEHKRVIDFFGITQEELPTFRMTAMVDDMLKYKPEDKSLTEANFRDFVKKFKAGDLKPHLKSQELPEDWDANPVKVLVNSNFESVAMQEGKDVLVEFYAPWCGHCKKLAPIWDELGEHFKDNEKIVIAKIDMTANELETVQVRGFPTLKLFKADNTVEDYKGGRELKDLVKFLDPSAELEAEVQEEVKADKTEL